MTKYERHPAPEKLLRQITTEAVNLLALGGPEEIYQSRVLERVMGIRLDRTEGPEGPRYFCALTGEG